MKNKQPASSLQSVRYWMGVAVIGVVVGVSLQFAQAWTNPTLPPPGGNVGGPINTSSIAQVKSGSLKVLGMFMANVGIDVGSWNGTTLLGQNRITNVATPIDGKDAVNKDYADKLVVPESTITKSYKIVSHRKLNELINKGISDLESDRIDEWQNRCISSNESESTTKLYANKGCLNLLCYALTTKLPRISDINGNCGSVNKTVDCPSSRFEIHLSCLNTINDSDKRQDWPEIK